MASAALLAFSWRLRNQRIKLNVEVAHATSVMAVFGWRRQSMAMYSAWLGGANGVM